MFPAFERLIAFRYLRPSRSDRFVSVITGFSFLGIMLGVATLIVVMAVMNGFRQELFSKILGMNAHISIYHQTDQGTAPLQDYTKLLKQIETMDHVDSVHPVIEGQAMLSFRGKSQGMMVRGADPADFLIRPIFTNTTQGNISDLEAEGTIMIGQKMARRLGVKINDRINLLSPKGQVTVFGTMPKLQSFTVVAIFNVGMYEFDNGLAYLSLKQAQDFFGYGNGISALEITTTDPFNLNPIKTQLFPILPDDTQMTDWQRSHASFFNAIEVERNVMFLILTLIIVVAAFNIISGLVMLVKDKGSSIAVLRTMGASRAAIMRIFFLSGVSIGVVGTICGLILGIAFADNIESIRQFFESLSGTNLFNEEIYFLSKLPAQIDWSEVVSVTAMALGLSVLATIYPSWRAARLDPVEALRYE